jgi:prepilin-type N-terminal cleavage/methylation domain-containing protein
MKNHFLLLKIFSGKCMNFSWNKKGYTLVEIVIVIGIMALLSGIIFSSFDGAKAKSRDQQRLTDISNIQLGLELYFNKNGSYPKVLMGDTTDPGLVVNAEGVKYIIDIPTPPSKANEDEYKYNYVPLTKTLDGTRCISYHLWTTFEVNSANLESKRGFNSNSEFLESLTTTPLYNCGNSDYNVIDASSESLVYDVIPQ